MKATNRNRTAGDYIVIGTTTDNRKMYFNWHSDGMVTEKDQATGYHSKKAALYVIEQLKNKIPGYSWTTILDLP